METRPHLIIKPKKGWQLIDFKELRDHKDLFFFLITRDVKVRYKQTVLGALWAIIQPFTLMVVFSLFFGNLAKMPSDGIPYPIFSYSALIAWTYFSSSISASASSVLGSGGLISKVYFPRLIIPLAPVFTFLFDFIIAFVILLAMMLYYHIYPTIMVIFLPLLIILMMLTATGVGMLIASLGATYRDVGYIFPFIMSFWMFASPVVYPVSMIPEKYRLIYALNPMAGVIEGFRSALLGTVAFPTRVLLISGSVSIIIFIAGALYFRRTERYFADVI